MKTKTPLSICLTVLTAFLVLQVFSSPPLDAGGPKPKTSVYGEGIFELGDGSPPPGFPGVADILHDEQQDGPDWAALFGADGSAVDSDGDGIPDYIQSYGGQWVVFTEDDISLGSGFEGSALAPGGGVQRGVASADHDLGNVYIYSTFDPEGNLVLYGAAERLGGGDSFLELEFNQDHFQLGHGGYGTDQPWEVLGSRFEGDVLVKLTFTAGALGSADASVWASGAWSALDTIAGESCNDGELFCALCNGDDIDGGPWANYDTTGDPEVISAGHFVEVGLNVGALLGAQPAFTTVRVRTPEDISFGYFGEGN